MDGRLRFILVVLRYHKQSMYHLQLILPQNTHTHLGPVSSRRGVSSSRPGPRCEGLRQRANLSQCHRARLSGSSRPRGQDSTVWNIGLRGAAAHWRQLTRPSGGTSRAEQVSVSFVSRRMRRIDESLMNYLDARAWFKLRKKSSICVKSQR